jgi:hypothetical protein
MPPLSTCTVRHSLPGTRNRGQQLNLNVQLQLSGLAAVPNNNNATTRAYLPEGNSYEMVLLQFFHRGLKGDPLLAGLQLFQLLLGKVFLSKI